MSLQTKFDKTAAFLKRHETFLACSATAIATGALARYITTQQILVNDMAISLTNLRDECSTIIQENGALLDFLDNKQLRDEYLEFLKERAANS